MFCIKWATSSVEVPHNTKEKVNKCLHCLLQRRRMASKFGNRVAIVLTQFMFNPLWAGQSCFPKNCPASRPNFVRYAVCPVLDTTGEYQLLSWKSYRDGHQNKNKVELGEELDALRTEVLDFQMASLPISTSGIDAVMLMSFGVQFTRVALLILSSLSAVPLLCSHMYYQPAVLTVDVCLMSEKLIRKTEVILNVPLWHLYWRWNWT